MNSHAAAIASELVSTHSYSQHIPQHVEHLFVVLLQASVVVAMVVVVRFFEGVPGAVPSLESAMSGCTFGSHRNIAWAT